MNRRIIITLLVTTLWTATAMGQKHLTGMVYRSSNENPLTGVSITNLRSKQEATSAANGRYVIPAMEGDQVVFAYIGLSPDTVRVEKQLLISGYDASLTDLKGTLENVTVITNYQKDSLARREAYRQIYEKPPGITGRNTPQYGAGIVLSPFSFFSKGSRDKRKLKKQLTEQEKDDYIDYVFSPAWVRSITGLGGDSLSLFLRQYRPSYEFAREHDRAGLTIYVSDKLKLFMKKPK